MNRPDQVARFRGHARPWDVIVIGGGATGVGIAVDAASRGYDVLLVEQDLALEVVSFDEVAIDDP